jgi:hypothetical protein
MATQSQRRSEKERPIHSSKGKSRVLTAAPLTFVTTAPVAVQSDRLSFRRTPLIPASLRLDMIRDAAYFRAQARGFAPGQETVDWLAAEQEVDELIVRRYGG